MIVVVVYFSLRWLFLLFILAPQLARWPMANLTSIHPIAFFSTLLFSDQIRFWIVGTFIVSSKTILQVQKKNGGSFKPTNSLTCINWIVIADLPTPPPPTTTILNVWVWLEDPDDWLLYRDIFDQYHTIKLVKWHFRLQRTIFKRIQQMITDLLFLSNRKNIPRLNSTTHTLLGTKKWKHLLVYASHTRQCI